MTVFSIVKFLKHLRTINIFCGLYILIKYNSSINMYFLIIEKHYEINDTYNYFLFLFTNEPGLELIQ